MARKVSSWKQKKIYKIIAPENFEFQELGTTIANNPEILIGRRVDVSIGELTGDKSKQHLKILFEINNVKDDKAHTQFKAFSVNPAYIRSKIRKGMSKIDYTGNLKIEDSSIQIKIMAVTHHKIQSSQKREISRIMSSILNEHKGSKFNDFIQSAIFGRLGTEIYQGIKKICPIRRVEIEQIKVL